MTPDIPIDVWDNGSQDAPPDRASTPTPKDEVRSIHFFSQILRVGRSNWDGPVEVRVTLHGKNYDLPLNDKVDLDLVFQAAKDGQTVSLLLEVHWFREQGLRVDEVTSKVVSVEKYSCEFSFPSLTDSGGNLEPPFEATTPIPPTFEVT